MAGIYQKFMDQKKTGKKAFAVLIDPDKMSDADIDRIVDHALQARVDYFFVGGSLVVVNTVDQNIQRIKSRCDIPVVLFPGSPSQVSKYADALFYLSLISGRNPELLIGQHVISAAMVRSSGLEIMPTGYMVIDGGAPTSVSYIANTAPIPADKDNIALCTAMAGEMLGLRLIYMDAGSGAKNPIQENMIRRVAGSIAVPLIVGGGIRTPEKAAANCKAGADVIVVGNAIEKDIHLMQALSEAVHQSC
ncbi:putative glycerol-1-phosphate prenyltransferase [Arachidicoccus rhizosphaerae]|uniref:Geranylgeranylglyceryl phosphate synthase n=1 Tax=Arachidicoccus rhizosphaerae TaxID=551991 RepID=A0A1H3XW22_9BACT|nr:geranylgeranylglyceryl/heptaprenylglyceryl phosphate synthase [Arachidicoccus rhizosphaerae]SEA03503.1 putative glycerol-1-phosphate prenyltransferase [Arachidicoccus rhizosphaerae]